MIYYHGTTDAWLSSILKEGLKPDLKNAWRVSGTQDWNENEHLREVEPVKFVYVTKSLKRAKQFAEAKAEYLSLKPGQESSWFFMKKDSGAEILKNAKPVVLKVEIPDSSDLIQDERDTDFKSFKYEGVIPPSRIKVYKGEINEQVPELG